MLSITGLPPQGYLAMTQVVHDRQAPHSSAPKSRLNTVSAADQLLLDNLTEHLEDIPDEEEITVVSLDDSQDVSCNFLTVTYHIVFSPSYQVPVLYFNAYRPDGVAIPIEDIYRSLVPEDWQSSIRDAGLNGGISQQDHPILNGPFFYMHPCETVSLMETILSDQTFHESRRSFLDSYITTWLSLTGQAVGVTIPSGVVAHTI
ncbi:autophagocytosis associated protein [Gamsiella multidivaricata]|uniref:autophagocytosis associated protein n=1 Tax=Gamsiella multidivaricata TaxID=101098 RepID=UPI00221EBB03|nr:autophagocytosis associated protein [Gamsiella multidivaricata]KAI7820683.1 autophagocytosis associated protein [Gamsiella multidivaricata]